MPKPPRTLLVDRYVRFEDDLVAAVKESGQPSLDLVIESVLGGLPDSSSREERYEAVDAEIKWYMEEVYEPAFEFLRERRISCPSTVERKVPVEACTTDRDLYYSELLDGIEPCLSPLDGAPSVATLTLGLSWDPKHPIRSYPLTAYIAGSDAHYFVLYVGNHRPGSPDQGFYLVYDTLANSLSIIPPLSPSGSHWDLGDQVAILAIRYPCFYVIAELLFRLKSHSSLPTNMGTLCMWWSEGSGALATGRWIQRDVVLPIPADQDSTSTTPTYSFHADMIIPVLGKSIFWVDLLQGILVCDNIDLLADDFHAPIDYPGPVDIVFYFIPLPDGCAIQTDWCKGRGQPDEYRSMCSITYDTFKFVCMEPYSEGHPMDKVLFRAWALTLHWDKVTLPGNNVTIHGDEVTWRWNKLTWRWNKLVECRVDIWNDPIYKNDLKLQPLTPKFPILSSADHDIIYVLLTDFKFEQGCKVATGSYVLGLHIHQGNIASAIGLPCDKNGMVLPLKIFASDINFCLMEDNNHWTEGKRNRDLAQILVKQKFAQGRFLGKFGEWTSCEEEDPLMTYTLGAYRGKSGKWTIREEDEPMTYKLEAHFATMKFCQDGLGGRRIISTPGASSSSSRNEPSASVGLQAIMDEPLS